MTMDGTFPAEWLDYFASHAIDPAVATRAGVCERDGRLIFPYNDDAGPYKRARALDGKPSQPKGRALACWWPAGRPEQLGRVLVCEGEPDALAALTAIERADDPAGVLGALAVVAVPGASFPADRLVEELQGVEQVILAPDADEAGNKFATRAAEALKAAGIPSGCLALLEGLDLADQLAAEGPDWLAHTIADLEVETTVALAPTAPPGEPIDTAHLLGEVEQFVRRFVVLPADGEYVALSLFVLHTWAFAAAHATPYLVVESPEKQSGKTRLLEVLALICHNPAKVASITAAALFQTVAQGHPTLLIDEADAIFAGNSERNEDLRGVLNAGNAPGSPVIRGGRDGQPLSYDVFCPKVIAGIATGRLPETVRDRAVILLIDRKLKSEKVERLRRRRIEDDIEALRSTLAAWAEESVEGLADYDLPDPLDQISDRLEEAWEPLLAIADLAGDEYPAHARAAAVDLAGGADGEVGYGAQLLAGVKAALAGREVIPTADLLRLINAEEELPFGGWRDGRGLDSRGLARMLRPYGVRPKSVRTGPDLSKGYAADDFRETFSRYVSDLPTQATQATQANNGGALDVSEEGDVSDNLPTHPPDADTENPRKHGDVSDVSDVSANPTRPGDDADNLPDGWSHDDLDALQAEHGS
jgi:hypothetical protein